MKILYAIQGTGNGHLARAMDVIPCLQKRGSVDILLSGTQADIQLPYPIAYRYKGLSFIFGRSGGVDIWQTIAKASLPQLIKEIRNLPVRKYDLIISDFEPISSWACKLYRKPCVGLSHQIGVAHQAAPQTSRSDVIGKAILKYYAPAKHRYGFHFEQYADNIFTPVIRKQVRDRPIENKGHYTVYLPAFDDATLIAFLSRFPDVSWEVFSKHNARQAVYQNVKIFAVDNDHFISSMAASAGVLCGAGFETPAEALYLRKKVLAVPMTNQYEQHLNAAALNQMGVPVINSLHPKSDELVRQWLSADHHVPVLYENSIQQIIDYIIEKHCAQGVVPSSLGVLN